MKQLITRAGLEVGKRVRYVPGHANGNTAHPDCEDGVITSWSPSDVTLANEITVFVRYFNKDGSQQQSSKGTYPRNRGRAGVGATWASAWCSGRTNSARCCASSSSWACSRNFW